MKCDNCKKNDANFHSITNINGKVTEKHLCTECAKKDSDFIDKRETMFNDFISDFKTSLSFFSPITNLGFDNFFEDDFFNAPILVTRKDNKEIKEKQKEFDNTKQKQLELNKLDLQLKKAVVEERYEDAIVIRDKIKALKDEK